DLDREGRSAGGLEARIIGRVVDDLPEPELLVEFDRARVIRPRHGDLVEPRAGADVEPDALLADRSGALAQLRRVVQRNPDELAGASDRVGERRPGREE